MTQDQKAITEMNYEEAVAELESIVTQLEVQEQNLEGAIALYERGQALTRHCAELLEKAELRIRSLDDAEAPGDA